MEHAMTDALWMKVQDEALRQIAKFAPRIMLAGSASAGKRKLRDLTEATAGDELYARLKGTVKMAEDDPVAVIILGGKKFILGPISNEDQTEITYDLPIVGEKGFNSPFTEPMTIANAAVTGTNTSTSTYEVNIQNLSFDLPDGTWTVFAWGEGLYGHSVANGVVRVHMQVGSDAGTALTAACQLSPGRTSIAIANEATGQTGSIQIRMEYRCTTVGTATAGGGWLKAIAWRTS
jgi:hypothetical protein